MSYHDQNGWPVNLARELGQVATWEHRGVHERLRRDEAIFRFFQCPCRHPGRKPHRIEDCDYVQARTLEPGEREARNATDLAKRLRSALSPIGKPAS